MGEDTIKNDLEIIESGVATFEATVEKEIAFFEANTSKITADLQQKAEYQISGIELSLLPILSRFNAQVNHRLIRVTFHASPEIIALTLAMVAIYNIVTFAIVVFKVITILATIWRIHQILASLWPSYRQAFNKLMAKVSQVSEHIGWGVDGIGHLINAVDGGINVLGGLMGKNWTLMRFEMMQKGDELVIQMSRMLTALKTDPGRWINQMFENRFLLTANDTAKWWQPIAQTIEIASDRAQTAAQGVQGVIRELQSIQTGMPEAVRRNIPQSIWNSLAQADYMIDQRILPVLTEFRQTFDIINKVLRRDYERMNELAQKLAHPGEILLSVDDLPDYAKQTQLGMIDDVTSREFEFWTNQERSELQADLNDFDRIDRLMTAPTPQPGFLGMEIPRGATIRGITAEPKETWFIGGYGDPR